MFYVYILISEATGKYYKGQTENIEERFSRHNAGRESATRHGIPWKLVWFTEKETRKEAMELEVKLKNLSRKRTEVFILKHSSSAT